MSEHIVPAFTTIEATGAVLIAFVYIAISSLLAEPNRQKLSAIIVAGAGAAYLSGGLGLWEFAFCTLITFFAFKGLRSYRYIAAAWLLHAGWDIMHHLYGNPIVSLDPSSSAGCAICDIILATWFFFNAPSIFELLKSRKPVITT